MVLLFAAAACTTVGRPAPAERARIDFGARAEIRVCLLRDDGVSEAQAHELIRAVGQEMAPYGIALSVPWVRPWQRPGFMFGAILAGVAEQPLEPPCDRLLALVSRHVGDALWGVFLPEALGAVETVTHTHGYVVARSASLNQVFSPPAEIARHEFYHMLGCSHALSLGACYRQIAAVKHDLLPADDFFPGISQELRPLRSRAEVAAQLASVESLPAH